MDKYLKIILGLLIALVGVYSYIQWPSTLASLWILVKGSVGLMVIFIGLLFILIGISE